MSDGETKFTMMSPEDNRVGFLAEDGDANKSKTVHYGNVVGCHGTRTTEGVSGEVEVVALGVFRFDTSPSEFLRLLKNIFEWRVANDIAERPLSVSFKMDATPIERPSGASGLD